MRMNTWKLWLIAGNCFLMAGIFNLVDGKTWLTIVSFLLSIFYFYACRKSYIVSKAKWKEFKARPLTWDQENHLKDMLKNGKRIRALRDYRMFTGEGLKEAKEFMDKLDRRIK